ncbi:MAG: amino acid permease [Acidimicrobiia bacterium]|nr:amino acid permease [Acidimicrobiia bacterium]
MPEPSLRRHLGLPDLVLFNISAVVGVRWLAAAAHVGPTSIWLWLLAAVFFFVPTAMVVSELAGRMPQQGGIYRWTQNSFGDWHAFLCAWCYWTNNLFYLPSLALAGVTMALYVFGSRYQHLETSSSYALTGALLVIWLVTLLNARGLGVGKWVGNTGGLCMFLGGALLVIAAAYAALQTGSATSWRVLPALDWERVNFWPQLAFAFGGLELSAILGGEISNVQSTIRRAAWISAAAIATFYIGGTAAILLLLPPDQVSIINGITQAGFAAGQIMQFGWLSPLLALLITAGIAGQLGSWVAGCARLPMVLGVDHMAPAAFTRLPVSLVFQAAASSLFLLAMHLGDDLRTGYQLLVDMAVITYFIPFLYLFLTAWKHGLRWPAAAGLVVTLLAVSFSFVPPRGVDSVWLFEAKLVGGTVLLILAAKLWFSHRLRATRA